MDGGDEDFIPEGFSKSATDDAKDKKNQGDQRKAELEMKIRHRVACEAKAFDIVNRLIEETVSEEYLQNCCQFIDGSHYADIVEERAITRICGYPLCNKGLEQIPKQKYRISTKSNTVYDISERKNFCSNQCYKASKHVAKQVPSSPVWSRENDPKRKIHFLDTTNNLGAVGEEVIGTHMLTVREELRALERLDINDTSSANEDASSVASKAAENSPQKFSTQKQQEESKTEYLMHLLSSKKKLFSKMADIQFANDMSDQTVISDDHTQTISTVHKEDESQISNPGSEQHEGSASQKTDEKTVDIKDQDSKPFCTVRSKEVLKSDKPATSILDGVCDIICHWITEETLLLLGFSAREDPASDIMLGHAHGDPDIQQNYRNLCQRLAGQEKDFEEFLGEEGVSKKDVADSLKPIPSFDKLKKKSQEYQLKVREFYESSQVLKIQRKSDEVDNSESKEAGMKLPAVDSYDQMLIRRRIVLERLDRVMPTLLPPLGLAIQDVSSLLREMIFTFSFTNENIIFQPAEWNLVGMVLLKMLARKFSVVTSSFEKSAHKMTFDLVLTKLGHSLESLDKLVTEMLFFCHRHFQQNIS